MTKNELKQYILTEFGYPVVKVELHDDHLTNAIDFARSKYIKWAVGNATQETWFTLVLSGGQSEYELPSGVTEVIDIEDSSSDDGSGGINTLFSYQNYLYNTGAMGFLNNSSQGGILDMHTTMEFLDLLDTYTADKYSWIYHSFTNKIKIYPAPDTGNTRTLVAVDGSETTVDSPGYIMIRSFMIDGSNLTTDASQPFNNWLYDNDWIKEYATAKAKEVLGYIRRKFANFGSIGNIGISLDGDTLVSEAKDEMQQLEETLRMEECFEGGYICVS